MLRSLVILCFLTILISVSCSNDNNNPSNPSTNDPNNSFVVNGDGFKDAVFYIDSSISTLVFDNNNVAIVLSGKIPGKTTHFNLMISYPGPEAKNIVWDPTTHNNSVVLQMEFENNIVKHYAPVSGTLNVGPVGSVGDFTTGSFSGTMMLVGDQSQTQITLTNGKFKVKRYM